MDGIVASGRGHRDLAVPMSRVVQDLEFWACVPGWAIALNDAKHHAAVAAGLHPPVEPKLEVVKGVNRDQITSAVHSGQCTVDRGPAVRTVALLVAAPGR